MRLLPVYLLIIVVSLLGYGLYKQNNKAALPFEPYNLPFMEFEDLASGQTVFAEDFPADVPIVVHYFASWCAPCVPEHDRLYDLSLKWSFPIYGVVWNDSRKKISAWLDNKPKFYTQILLDADGKTGVELGIRGIPETFLIRNGRVLFQQKGPMTEEIWLEKFAPHFAQR